MKISDATQIETERLLIRVVKEADVPALFAINGDDAVTRFLPYETWKERTDGDAWFQRTAKRSAAGEVIQFVIMLRATGALIGTCLLFHFDQPSARAELGYVLARTYWGSGYMLEAMQGLVAFAFEELQLRRLEAEVDPRNIASARLLERLGFVEEGRLRERWVRKGDIADAALYGLLRADWSGPPSR